MTYSLSSRETLLPRSLKTGPYTVEADEAVKIDGETLPRRHPSARLGLRSKPEPGIATVYDILIQGAVKFDQRPAIGFRRVVDKHTEVKQTTDRSGQRVDKEWSYCELSDYDYVSYDQFKENALTAGYALRKLGLQKYDRVQIYAATSPFWYTVAQGASSQTIAIATAYDTLGEEGLLHSLVEAQAKAIFFDQALLPQVTKVIHNTPLVRSIVYSEDPLQPLDLQYLDQLKAEHPNIAIWSFKEFMELGEELVEPVPPNPEDLMCIMYTSGSTGPPKGVLLKHSTVVAAIAGVDTIIGPHVAPGERVLAYLPLAHIIEFVLETATLYWGGVLGYGNPRTLTDDSVRHCQGDLRAFRPTFMVGVPAVWETVKKGIISKVGEPYSLKSRLFSGALVAKETLLYWGLPGAHLLDSLVFNQVKAVTGGNLRFCLNGGGAIAEATQKFISLAICPMLGGYGLTETAGCGALTDPHAWTSSAIGPMPASVEVKLIDCAELSYFTAANPPQGEVFIRGGAVTEGYLNNAEENARAFEDGWFKTGDIGEFDRDGRLKIIDRRKNLVKTLNGEYIALEKLESRYRSARCLTNICIYASSDHTRPIALISPSEPVVLQLAHSAGLSSDATFHAICSSSETRKAVCKELQEVGRQNGLHGVELVENVIITEDQWTPQNGLVTSAQKLNRRAVVKQFKAEIEEAYRRSPS